MSRPRRNRRSLAARSRRRRERPLVKGEDPGEARPERYPAVDVLHRLELVFDAEVIQMLVEEVGFDVQKVSISAGGVEVDGVLLEKIDMATFRRIADHVTVAEREKIYGRININTAQPEVLQTLGGVTVQLANGIVQYRSGLAGGYSSIAELLAVPGVSIGEFRRFAELITVRSNVFAIRSFARVERTGLTHSIHAVIDRGEIGPVVLYWREGY